MLILPLQITGDAFREAPVEELAHIMLTYKNKATALVSLGWLTSRDLVDFTVSGTGGVAKGGYRYLEVGYADLLQTDMYKNGKKSFFTGSRGFFLLLSYEDKNCCYDSPICWYKVQPKEICPIIPLQEVTTERVYLCDKSTPHQNLLSINMYEVYSL